jgi:hypothetical protein
MRPRRFREGCLTSDVKVPTSGKQSSWANHAGSLTKSAPYVFAISHKSSQAFNRKYDGRGVFCWMRPRRFLKGCLTLGVKVSTSGKQSSWGKPRCASSKHSNSCKHHVDLGQIEPFMSRQRLTNWPMPAAGKVHVGWHGDAWI